MQVIELPVSTIEAPGWNPNAMDSAMRERLRHSIQRFGVVAPLVVRKIGTGEYETVGGAQRLSVLREMGVKAIPCMVVEADDTEARLLAQSLNRIQGEDNPGLKAGVVRHLMERLPEHEVLALLPETTASLASLAALGQQDLAQHLQSWQAAQSARLKHFHVQLTPYQMVVVETALGQVMPQASEVASTNPNLRGNALYLLCKAFLETREAMP